MGYFYSTLLVGIFFLKNHLSYANVIVGNGFGNCNNRESKYVKAYSPDILNTIDKMAQKRALVSAVLFTTGGSRFFGQKVADLNS
ncbi:hypothetical protein [Pleurocapsa sp. PCC 7319]|uniref:hypothetical protein n=1 Tax=Pleurocapsa sp. PCC 7319 TaxID=118161 RepID=UPI00034CFB18|nr:hypothetical protein [Pleurocapsa sp. PCC 7319]